MRIIVNHTNGDRSFFRGGEPMRYENGRPMAVFTKGKFATCRRTSLATSFSAEDAENWVQDAHSKSQAMKANGITFFEVA